MVGTAGGMMALAGCSGDQSTDTTTSSETEGGGGDTPDETSGGNFVPADNSFANQTTDNPTNWQHNVYNFTKPFEHPLQNDMFQRYNIAKDEYTEYLVSIDEWTPEDEKAVLKVRDGVTWHNGNPGDPVTAKDLKAKLVCEDLINATLASHYTDLKVVGDRRLELTLDGAVNKPLFREALNYYWLDTPYRKYKKFVESWTDATTDKEKTSIKNELRNATFDEPHGNGPFKYKSRSSNRYRMELYEHHPDADNINFQFWDVVRVSTDTASVALNMVPNGKVDTIRNYTPPESVYQSRKDGHMTNQLPALWGQSLPFNCSHEDYGKVRVRQAVAEFIDRGEIARNYGRWGQNVQAPSGLLGNIAGDNSKSNNWKRWVSNEGAQALHRYQNPKRGRRLLREEGYEKVNGTWQRPDGTPLKLPIKVPADYTDWHPIYQTAVSNLKQEGIQASTVMIDSTSYWPDHYLAGNHVAASTGWTLQWAHPYYNFGMYYRVDNTFMNLKTDQLKAPPFGKPDGKLQSVDVESLMEKLRTSTEETQTQYIDQLAWIVNQTIPMLPLIEINDVIWMTDDDWDLPAKDDERYQAKWPQWWFPRMGLLKAKSK